MTTWNGMKRTPMQRKPRRRRRITAEIRRLVPLGGPCAYCGKARSIHRDHIVPVALRRRHPEFNEAPYIVGACGPCNLRKGTRRYAPPGFDLSILPGKGWQTWSGGDHLEIKR